MANIASFAINVILSGSVANPVNSTSFQLITPWGKSPVCATLLEAVNAVFEGKGGSPYSGRMGSFFLAQTLNGASGSGPAAYTAANEVGV